MPNRVPSLDAALTRFSDARVAVFGDFALDAYWTLDPDLDEHSLETGLAVRRVAEQRYGLGGAANVAANAAALGAGGVAAVGLVGDDLFGRELRSQLAALGIETEALRSGPPGWQTTVFAKPHLDDNEESRLDFGTRNTPGGDDVAALAQRLDDAASAATAIVLNQQAPAGITSPAMIDRINAIIARHPDRVFVVDSRDHAPCYRGAVVAINEREATTWSGAAAGRDPLPIEALAQLAREIRGQTGQPVFVTCGARGLVAADASGEHIVPGVPVPPPIDTVGAGDAVTAALATALGSGCDLPTAAHLANLAATVTVTVLRDTGTATPGAIRALAAQLDDGA